MPKFIITGIQMRNKGSQAMFLSLYYALKANFRDCEVLGFANKYDNAEQYAFTLLPYDAYTRFLFKYRLDRIPGLHHMMTYLLGLFRNNRKWLGAVPVMTRALREADAIFDASGYTLGSGWDKEAGELLLDTIRTARRYRKDILLMPQSFGPFDWGEADDARFNDQIREELAYCRKIYAREKEGHASLTGLGLKNVELSADMVIRERFFPVTHDIHAPSMAAQVSYPAKGSVGFILNANVFRVGDPGAVLRLYADIVNRLVGNGEQVHILNSSTADARYVEELVAMVKFPERVRIISGEYSSPQLIEIISRFKYVVASRYHSVVFAYRSGVPAVILGWASKYQDLAEHFEQQDYVFDIKDPNIAGILEKIDRMGQVYEAESRRIIQRLDIVQESSVVSDALACLRGEDCVELEPVPRRRGPVWPAPLRDLSTM